jgi:hypothetical protein
VFLYISEEAVKQSGPEAPTIPRGLHNLGGKNIIVVVLVGNIRVCSVSHAVRKNQRAQESATNRKNQYRTAFSVTSYGKGVLWVSWLHSHH